MSKFTVSYSNTWGTVCGSNWGYAEASVVCKQLGLHTGATNNTGVILGSHQGQLTMDGVACIGQESRLVDCPSFGWNNASSCSSSSRAEVVCGKAPLFCSKTVIFKWWFQ